jgi:hypothetical protein
VQPRREPLRIRHRGGSVVFGPSSSKNDGWTRGFATGPNDWPIRHKSETFGKQPGQKHSETLSVGIADWGTDFESRGGHSSVRPEDFVLFSRQWLTWVPVTQVKN